MRNTHRHRPVYTGRSPGARCGTVTETVAQHGAFGAHGQLLDITQALIAVRLHAEYPSAPAGLHRPFARSSLWHSHRDRGTTRCLWRPRSVAGYHASTDCSAPPCGIPIGTGRFTPAVRQDLVVAQSPRPWHNTVP